jgi:hypothetical protein
MLLHNVPEPKGIHLVLVTEHYDEEIERLTGLGARPLNEIKLSGAIPKQPAPGLHPSSLDSSLIEQMLPAASGGFRAYQLGARTPGTGRSTGASLCLAPSSLVLPCIEVRV